MGINTHTAEADNMKVVVIVHAGLTTTSELSPPAAHASLMSPEHSDDDIHTASCKCNATLVEEGMSGRRLLLAKSLFPQSPLDIANCYAWQH